MFVSYQLQISYLLLAVMPWNIFWVSLVSPYECEDSTVIAKLLAGSSEGKERVACTIV